MRVSLTPDPAEFVKQIADLRRGMNRLERSKDRSDAIKARLMIAVFVPYLQTLRTELRDEGYSLPDLIQGVSELMGNLAASMIQSTFDEIPESERDELLRRIHSHAYDTATMTFANDDRMARDQAEKARPKLAVVPADVEAGSNVLPLTRKKKGE